MALEMLNMRRITGWAKNKNTNSAENLAEIISFLHLGLIVNFVHVQIYWNDKHK